MSTHELEDKIRKLKSLKNCQEYPQQEIHPAEESAMIETGMIVRYSPQWCSPGERRYLHVVTENRLNPVTGKMTRWLIETINMKHMTLHPTSEVEDYMIEPTGFNIRDYIPDQK